MLSTLARDAIEVFAALDEGRVRACDADDCRMVFHDESRTNNRRWCSMEHCGNRAKVRAHRERAAMRRHKDLSALDEGRVRACDADTCRMVYHDESRTNNRRWCSMEHCGNRAKVRAHRERAAMRRHEEKERA